MSVYFITGIDTDIGKTIATGSLARALHQKGCKVITQKLVQTGCNGIAEDIMTHREIMGIGLQSCDIDMTTCPYVFQKPASPHLASKLENTIIEPSRISDATNTLKQDYDIVLLEGAGGLMVPLSDKLLTIDYIEAQGYPVVLVTSGRLGSINHTLLSIEALAKRNLPLHAIIYNDWQPDKRLASEYSPDDEIVDSTKDYLQTYLANNHPDSHWIDLPNNSAINTDDLSDSDCRSSLNNYAEHLI
ncbi:dethiobiotin synthase [Psychrobacter lutiphocae]|uniref:dethiobiotin synthase n=1 Tax=Psychrobacter lutiphocae TaxID=540500 RepID=UPI000376BED1|nr:dethiobiotin synthase [Psychrobacter lutiphocae]